MNKTLYILLAVSMLAMVGLTSSAFADSKTGLAEAEIVGREAITSSAGDLGLNFGATLYDADLAQTLIMTRDEFGVVGVSGGNWLADSVGDLHSGLVTVDADSRIPMTIDMVVDSCNFDGVAPDTPGDNLSLSHDVTLVDGAFKTTAGTMDIHIVGTLIIPAATGTTAECDFTVTVEPSGL